MNEPAKPKLFALRYFLFDFIKVTAALPTLLWLRPKRFYANEKAKKKLKTGMLIIANHTDFPDPIYLMTAFWYRRLRFVFSEEVAQSRAGGFFKACGCLEINRQNPTLGSFKKITDALKQGEAVAMFPEGHISGKEGDAFKSGMVLMALRSGVPIVPVYIKPRKGFLDRLSVTFGEAVDVTTLYGRRPTFKQINEATTLLYERERELRELMNN